MIAAHHLLFFKTIADAKVITDSADIEKYCRPERGNEIGKTSVVVMPTSTKAVSEILRYCSQHAIHVVPQGGLTGLAGGSIPDDSGSEIVLNLSLMNQMIAITDDHATAQAGMVLSTFKDAVSAQGRFFPLSYGSEQSAQIGGAVSTNAGGINFLQYGGARQLTLGLEVVLMDGRVIQLGNTVPKDNSGYDLKDIVIGSEGTLAVVTHVTFKLFDPPVQNITLLVGLRDLDGLSLLFKQLRLGMSNSLTAFELMDAVSFGLGRSAYEEDHGALTLLEESYPWYLLIECSTSSPYLDLNELFMKVIESGNVALQLEDVMMAGTLEKSHDLWGCRHRISDAAKHHAGITFDISAEDIKQFVASFTLGLRAIDAQLTPVIFGHAGDFNLHVHARHLGSNQPFSVELKAAIEQLVLEILLEMRAQGLGVSISAEHGVGRHKKALLQAWTNPTTLQLMHQLKSVWDPQGLLHPGVILDHKQ